MVRLYVGWNQWPKPAIQASMIWGLSRNLIAKGKLSSSKLSPHSKPLSCLKSWEDTTMYGSDVKRYPANLTQSYMGITDLIPLSNDVIEMFLNGFIHFLQRFVEEPGRQGFTLKSTGFGRVLLMEWCTLTSRLLEYSVDDDLDLNDFLGCSLLK